jgi:F0F1-type ATP synthase assembly protein I
VRLIPEPSSARPHNESISNGAELVGAVVVFFLIGLGLDTWFDTKPIFMILLTVFAVIAQFVRMYVVYTARMMSLEKKRADSARGAIQ